MLLVSAGSILQAAAQPAQPAPGPLSGTLPITGGRCGGGGVTGSYFRMILPTGNRSGPFIQNGDSTCPSDTTFTPLQPGTDGGLAVGGYQAQPNPTFDGAGNSLANRLTAPAKFFGVNFSTATNPTDPQTGTPVPAPSLSLGADGTLTGDLRAFAASWNGQHFNQGAPKPDGSSPGNTTAPTGSLDPSTGAFTLEWTSQIVGGPFDDFTGLWHLEGQLPSSGGGVSDTNPDTPAATGGEQQPQAGPSNQSVAGSPTESTPTTGAAATAAPTVANAGQGEPDAAANPIVADSRQPSTWLIMLVTLIGLAALASFLILDRRIRRTEVPT